MPDTTPAAQGEPTAEHISFADWTLGCGPAGGEGPYAMGCVVHSWDGDWSKDKCPVTLEAARVLAAWDSRNHRPGSDRPVLDRSEQPLTGAVGPRRCSFTVELDIAVPPDTTDQPANVLRAALQDLLAEIRQWAARSDADVVADSAHMDMNPNGPLPGRVNDLELSTNCPCGWRGASRIRVEVGDSGITDLLIGTSCPGCGHSGLKQHRIKEHVSGDES